MNSHSNINNNQFPSFSLYLSEFDLFLHFVSDVKKTFVFVCLFTLGEYIDIESLLTSNYFFNTQLVELKTFDSRA